MIDSIPLSENTLQPNSLRPLGSSTFDKSLQPENAPSFMLKTLSGILIADNLLHPEKAHSPIVLTLLGIRV